MALASLAAGWLTDASLEVFLRSRAIEREDHAKLKQRRIAIDATTKEVADDGRTAEREPHLSAETLCYLERGMCSSNDDERSMIPFHVISRLMLALSASGSNSAAITKLAAVAERISDAQADKDILP